MTVFGSAMISTQSEKYYTVKQASEMIGCDYSTLQKACKDGKINCRELPASRGTGSTFMVTEFVVREWDKSRKHRNSENPLSSFTVEELAQEINKRIQKAYDDGYKVGRKDQRNEMLTALKGVQ